jgi:transmembrane sensor
MKYTNYNSEDFLQDEYFIQWVKKPDPQSDFFWKSWIENHPERREELQKAKEMVLLLRFPELAGATPSEQEMQVVFSHILEGKPTGREIDNSFAKHVKMESARNMFLKVAAIIALPIIALGIWQFSRENTEKQMVEPLVWQEKINPHGRRSQFMLPDGSRVNLNAGSILKFPEQFSDSIREVYLEGEAFFEVVKNPEKPFIVKTSQIQARVLGTSFNVRAYPNEKIEQVALATGKIQVDNIVKTGETLLLLPNELAQFDEQNQSMNKGKFDKNKLLAWKDGILEFDKANLEDVLPVLERWYGVHFEILTTKTIQGKFTGRFEKQSLDVVLRVLSETSNFHYKIEKNTVKISN